LTADKLWICNNISDKQIVNLAGEAGVSTLTARVCLNRGMDTAGEILSFINPSLKGLHDPFLLNDMDKAVERIMKAVANKESIVIYGDYDVDGVTSTSVLCRFLVSAGVDADFYIPDRMDEGYGVSKTAADKIIRSGASLVITVDCGITAVDEVLYLNKSGIDVIVTDHHECKERLPDAYAVINPCRPDSTYPFKELAGVGVAFKLINALSIRMDIPGRHLDYLDLVALGTVADVVPLTDENRVIVKYGMERITNTENTGLKALIDGSGLKGKQVDSFGVSFMLAPRINVAGRIGDAGRAVELFTTESEDKAHAIVAALNEDNKLRQDTESCIFQEAVDIIEGDTELQKDKVIVVAGYGWHHGVVGIVASKITEKYYKPCILISCEDGMGKASGRSIEGFNLFKALSYCESVLERYGGHELAAGLSLREENIPEFRRMINIYASSTLIGEELVPKLKIDAYLTKHDINIENIKELDRLAPFGAGNPVPLFAYNGFRLDDVRTVGENRHLKLRLEDRGFFVDAIGFKMGGIADSVCSDDLLDTAFSLEINTWNSVSRVQLILKDMHENSGTVLENEYYFTLNRCIDSFFESYNEGKWRKTGRKSLPAWCKPTDVPAGIVAEVLNNGKKGAILVNSIDSLLAAEKILDGMGTDIIKCVKICYTGSDTVNSGRICVIMNPIPEEFNFEALDTVLFFGSWISSDYFMKLVYKAEGKDVYCYKNSIEGKIFEEAAAVGRDDLAAVYRYIRSNFRGNLIIDDSFAYAKKIARSYKISMNYLKFMKSLEIFKELGLLTIKPNGVNGLSVSLPENAKARVELEDSVIYRKLQALKIQLGDE
jgi:single-stranded-DNA-specific exonuclease